MPNDIFDSCLRSAGDLAGVFEHDGETGYFYLHRAAPSSEVLDHIHIVNAEIDFAARGQAR